MRETVCSDDGKPCISALATYLSTQCSGTEIRALVKAVGAGTGLDNLLVIAPPVGPLQGQQVEVSPTFAHCVLKTLVAVYRKLGCYRSIAYPKGSLGADGPGRDAFGSPSSWRALEESFSTGRKSADTSSWSERARAAAASAAESSQSAKFRTPDPSPVRQQRGKDMEVSWSERRISSPLAEDDLEETWKRPLIRKTLRKKKPAPEPAGEKFRRGAEGEEGESSVCHNQVIDDIAELATDDRPLEDGQPVDSLTNPKKIEDKSRHDPDEGRNSKGFSPQAEYEDMDTERDRAMRESEVTGGHECGPGKNRSPGATDPGTAPASLDVGDGGDGPECTPGLQEEGPPASIAHSSLTDDDDEEHHKDGDEEDELVHSFDGTSGDKYHKLLSVIREFLTDYLNNMRETVCSDDGKPCISALITYLNSQCSGTEIRALVKAVGAGTGPGQPLGRLLHLSDHFKASKLKSVILGALPATA
ncbi:hypothetical protein Btru_072156 [Bulinus truncatus]|nr:hypothetical protein Btru_072156 [Bulinus truncatus]